MNKKSQEATTFAARRRRSTRRCDMAEGGRRLVVIVLVVSALVSVVAVVSLVVAVMVVLMTAVAGMTATHSTAAHSTTHLLLHKHLEEDVGVHATVSTTTESSTATTGRRVWVVQIFDLNTLVVPGLLLRVGQDFVGLANRLELRLGLFFLLFALVRVAIRVPLQRHLSVRALDLRIRRVLSDTENGVQIFSLGTLQRDFCLLLLLLQLAHTVFVVLQLDGLLVVATSDEEQSRRLLQ